MWEGGGGGCETPCLESLMVSTAAVGTVTVIDMVSCSCRSAQVCLSGEAPKSCTTLELEECIMGYEP